jgi:radical S-adenosyl methionine domain-containing protein 2
MNYVVNLHLLETCNFRCKHCFAKFSSNEVLSPGDWKRIVDNITRGMRVCRFNLAGGEPLLYSGLDEVVRDIAGRGIEVSLISNGYLLSEERLAGLREAGVSMVGISLDAVQPGLLRQLGRTCKGDVLAPERALSLCHAVKERGMRLKINTVVSALNKDEDFRAFIEAAQPDRWKILKMKRFMAAGFDNSNLEVSVEDYDRFLERHKGLFFVREVLMENTYILVDTSGKLINNSGDTYTPVSDLRREDFADAFDRLPFNHTAYNRRYKKENLWKNQ